MGEQEGILVLPGASKQEAEQKQSWERAGDTLRSRDSQWGHAGRGSCFVPQLSIIGNSLCGASVILAGQCSL